MTVGGWRMDGGWQMEADHRRMEEGDRWRMEDDRWEMGWPLEDGG
jgi:hypothetical protein